MYRYLELRYWAVLRDWRRFVPMYWKLYFHRMGPHMFKRFLLLKPSLACLHICDFRHVRMLGSFRTWQRLQTMDNPVIDFLCLPDNLFRVCRICLSCPYYIIVRNLCTSSFCKNKMTRFLNTLHFISFNDLCQNIIKIKDDLILMSCVGFSFSWRPQG